MGNPDPTIIYTIGISKFVFRIKYKNYKSYTDVNLKVVTILKAIVSIVLSLWDRRLKEACGKKMKQKQKESRLICKTC